MSSCIPAALAGLHAIAATALPNLQLGDAVLLETDDSFLIVGYENGNDPAVSGTRGVGDLRQAENVESFDVRNLVSVWLGDVDATDARVTLFGYLDTLDAAIRSSAPILGDDRITEAYITDFGLTQSPVGEGSTATVEFLVHVEAFI